MIGSIVALVLTCCLAIGHIKPTNGSGLADDALLREGTLLDRELGNSQRPKDTLFEENNKPHDQVKDGDESGLVNDESNQVDYDYSDYERVVRDIRVDVVAPNKDLAKLMNVISSKTRVMFLREYEHYFTQLNVGSTSRPMLLAHLGLQLTSSERLISWYKQQLRRPTTKSLVLDSCRSLKRKRDELLIGLNENDLSIIVNAKRHSRNRLHLSYLTFKNNLNLFMLENYLLLCSKCEPDQLDLAKLEPVF